MLSDDNTTQCFTTGIAACGAELESAGHNREQVADFLLRCAFSMFAGSLDLIPSQAFRCAVEAEQLQPMWLAMTAVLGLPETGIFADTTAFPLTGAARDALLAAADCDCAKVELTVFGAMVEKALDPKLRHALGAHYTPRAYIERLVRPTIEEPLRDDWLVWQHCARKSHGEGDQREALRVLNEFHARVCSTTVLDPACGTGNFLYVAMEIIQQIEDEVLDEFDALGFDRPTAQVTPAQFKGIEINPRAAQIADLVLQLAYLRKRHRANA